MAIPSATTVDEYIAGLPPAARAAVETLRELIRSTVPGVTERITYAMPTFDLDGRYVVYVAGWKDHISLYPMTGALADAFGDELEPYRAGKGTLRFPLKQPLPFDLIRRIVAFRVTEVRGA